MKNRELRFRAWDGYNLLSWDVVRKEHLDGLECDTWQWMQFIGLRDKNGTEIYEGDIVIYARSEVYQVVYSDKKACFSLSGVGRYMDIMSVIAEVRNGALTSIHTEKDFEVVGNIYEHSELLETTGNPVKD